MDLQKVFVCYSHTDRSRIEREITWLQAQGGEVWWDDGISPGTEWSDAIAHAIENCDLFIYFITPASVATENCKRELSYAVECQRQLLGVYLEPTEVPGGIKLQLHNRQTISPHELSEQAYRERLLDALTVTDPQNESGRAPPSQPSVKYQSKLRPVHSLALLLVITAAVLWWLQPVWESTPPDNATQPLDPERALAKTSIALLPFANLSADPDQVYFSDGISEDILTQLAKVEGIRVISSLTSFQFRGDDVNEGQIAQELNITHLLRGSVRRSGDQLRVNVRLIDAASSTTEWAETYDRPMDDVFAIQDEISAAVVSAIAPTLGVPAGRLTRPDDGRGYAQYLEARYLYTVGRTEQNPELVRQAMERFEAMVRDNPLNARAQAGLSDAWGALAILGAVAQAEGYENSRSRAETALEIDPTLADAWLALADVQFEYDWDLVAAARSYREALALEPQSAEGLRSYAFYLNSIGNASSAIDFYERTLVVDPRSFRARLGLHTTHLYAGNYSKADAMLASMQASLPYGYWAGLARYSMILQTRYDEAQALLPDELTTAFGIRDAAILAHKRGDQAMADALVDRLTSLNTSFPKHRMAAAYYALADDADRAFEQISMSLQQRELNAAELLAEPWIKDLGKDPRYWQILEEAGVRLPAHIARSEAERL